MHSICTAALWLQAADTGLSGANYLHIVMAISILSLVVAFLFGRSVLATDTGTPEMRRISDAIRKGAEAFMKRQNTTIIILAVALAVIIFLAYFLSGSADAWKLAAKMTISFVTGAICSLLAGFCGMWVSIRTNIRVASRPRARIWIRRSRSPCAAAQ